VFFFPLNIWIKFTYVFTTAPMEDASSMYSILLFYHPVWQKAHIIKVLHMRCSQVRCHCLPLIVHGTLTSNILTICLYTLLYDSQFHIHTKQQLNIFTSYQYIQLGRNIHAHLVKISINFLQMQLHTKHSLVTWNCKVKVCDFSF
jgi:hypothetical protein